MPHHRRTFVLAAALAFVACDEPPTQPLTAPVPRPAAHLADAPAMIAAQDLGRLPGDLSSLATYVADDGTVYGKSYPGNTAGAVRYFRWTQAGGMAEVGSIPSRPRPPFPPLPAPYGNAQVYARNAKGEATGRDIVGFDERADEPIFGAFRYSTGAGLRTLFRSTDAFYAETGWGINRWGHVSGEAMSGPLSDSRVFFWTPLDSVRVLTPHTSQDPAAQVNDVDQVIANNVQWGDLDSSDDDASFVWRPDLGGRRLGPTAAGCGNVTGACGVWVEAQQPTKSWVVGQSAVKLADGTVSMNAMLWRVPAVSRAAFPKVNANPYGGTGSTVSLSANGGRYYQTYTATQTTAAGPYVEHIDWGDGTGSRRSRSSISAMAAVSHVYTKRGTFYVRVYVKDAQGRWGVSERKVTVVS